MCYASASTFTYFREKKIKKNRKKVDFDGGFSIHRLHTLCLMFLPFSDEKIEKERESNDRIRVQLNLQYYGPIYV